MPSLIGWTSKKLLQCVVVDPYAKMIKCLWNHVLKMFNWLRYLKVCEWGRRNVFLRTRWECTRQLILIYICKSQRLKIKEWYSTLFSKHFMLKGLFGHVLKFNSVVQIRFILFNFQMVMRNAFLVTPTIVYRLNHKSKYKLYPTYEYIFAKWDIKMNTSSDTKYFIAFQFLSILQLKFYRSALYKLRRPQ